VSQDNVLFSTSIKENIIYGMGQGHLPMPTDEEIWAICDKANATEFINSFPNKLYTNVGERGVKLSGGQKQRIAIARAMIRSPTILLLDEATSALDAASEKVVQKALDDLLLEHDGVAVVVAHRLTTIKNCNTIIVMEKGKKVEEGSHEELLKLQVKKDSDGTVIQGYYHTQWDTQMGEESFGSAEHMNGEQLNGREKYFTDEIAKLVKERGKRAEAWMTVETKLKAAAVLKAEGQLKLPEGEGKGKGKASSGGESVE
jgi:ABC-type methionine transport system ATPase subunit